MPRRRNSRIPALIVRDRVRANISEPEVLRTIGIEAKRNGTNQLSSAKIDAIIKSARKSKQH